MRKLILPIVIIATLSACKKDNVVVENTPSVEDSVKTIEIPEVNLAAINLKEYSVAQTADYLENKDNDTLYVTNFFATWCRPCLIEIPHFKEKMEEMKNEKIKFTFIDIDDKADWDTAVKIFASENNLQNHIILLDNSKLDAAFFKNNFKQWDGGAIPYTIIKKGNKTDETLGSMSKEMLNEKLAAFK